MGLIISRFRRKKTTIDVLERLETQIKSIEQDDQYKERTHKRVIGYVMAYSVALYLFFAVLYYCMYAGKSHNWLHSVLHASPLLIFPILVVFLRAVISWYYSWTLNKNKAKLKKMREEKKKILEDVMNTETYKVRIDNILDSRVKVAKEILDKYGCPEDQSKSMKPFPQLDSPANPPSSPAPSTHFRKRLAIQNTSTPISNNNSIVSLNSPMAIYTRPRLRSEQLPRPLLDRNRSILDKAFDYILKEGPNYRMALICAQCYAHNGMAIAEEFEFISYVCPYCGYMNAARKQKPIAPPLTPLPALPPVPRRAIVGSGDDSPTASSESESDDEKNDDTITETGEGEPIRPPSPDEEEPKSEQEKKED